MKSTTRVVPLSEIDPPGDIDRRRETEHCQTLAADYRRDGRFIQPPTVRPVEGGRYELIVGRDRFTGATLAGAADLLVEVVEADDATAERWELEENLHRRKDAEEDRVTRARYIALMEQQEAKAAPVPRKPGGVKKPRTKAIEEAAKRAGVTPQAIRQQERRAKAKVEPEPAPEVATLTIKDLGHPVPEGVAMSARRIQAALREATGWVEKARVAIAQLGAAGMASSTAGSLVNDCAELEMALHKHMPYALCPNCHGVNSDDLYCRGQGSVSVKVLEAHTAFHNRPTAPPKPPRTPLTVEVDGEWRQYTGEE